MKLIDNVRQAWRFASMQVAAVAILFGALPSDTQAAVLNLVGIPQSRLPAILGVLVMLARIVQQPGVTK